MTEMYNQQDFVLAARQRKIVRIVLMIAVALYLTAALGTWGWYLTLPYKSPTIATLKAIEGVLAGIFVIFMFVFCGIKVRRVNKYCKMLHHLQTGLTENNEGTFLRFETKTEVVEGVDYRTMILSEWYEKKKEFYERKVLIDAEKSLPDFQEGDVIRYVTQGNILVRYAVAAHKQEDEQ